jgi:hypothetical protein
MSRIGRWLVGLGTAVALAGLAGAPAAAAAATEFELFLGDVTVAPDGPGVERQVVVAGVDDAVVLTDLTITIDYGDVAAFAEVRPPEISIDPECTDSSNVITCRFTEDVGVDEFGSGEFTITLVAKPTATAGQSGTIVIGGTAVGASTTGDTTRVRIGEGVDLSAPEAPPLSGRFGSVVAVPLSVANVGQNPAHGVVAVMFRHGAIDQGSNHSNCRYGILVVCHFDQDLRPGFSYTADFGTKIGADAPAPGSVFVELIWQTPADHEDLVADVGEPPLQPGTGAPLTLTESPAARSALPPQTDTEPSNNSAFYEITVTGTNRPDVAVIGATVSGEVGAVVPVTVAIHNVGTATLDASGVPAPAAALKLIVPPGTTVTEIEQNCFPATGEFPDFSSPGQPGQRSYVCVIDEFIFPPGARTEFEFDLRIDEVIANSEGQVRFTSQDGIDRTDKVAANNVAKIVVNPADLPVTGARIGTVVALGGALVLLGAVLLVLTRRRAPRPDAA